VNGRVIVWDLETVPDLRGFAARERAGRQDCEGEVVKTYRGYHVPRPPPNRPKGVIRPCRKAKRGSVNGGARGKEAREALECQLTQRIVTMGVKA
jgi:hypothetical protein